MLLALIIAYTVTLLYACVIERFRLYALVMGLQGWLLLAIAYMQLEAAPVGEIIFVITETLVFKGLLVPYLMLRIIKKLKVNRVHKSSLSPMPTLIIALGMLGASAYLTMILTTSHINPLFLGTALFAMFVGLLLITVHRRIFTHMVGFLIIENAVFFFSLAVGAHMPMLVNIGVLLDILMGVLILGMFITRLNTSTAMLDSDELTKLRD